MSHLTTPTTPPAPNVSASFGDYRDVLKTYQGPESAAPEWLDWFDDHPKLSEGDAYDGQPETCRTVSLAEASLSGAIDWWGTGEAAELPAEPAEQTDYDGGDR